MKLNYIIFTLSLIIIMLVSCVGTKNISNENTQKISKGQFWYTIIHTKTNPISNDTVCYYVLKYEDGDSDDNGHVTYIESKNDTVLASAFFFTLLAERTDSCTIK